MARKLLAGFVVAVALGGVAQAAGDQLPILRSASVLDRRVVVDVAATDFRPEQLTVATSRAVDADGVLVRKNVRLREAIQVAQPASGVVRWQSRTPLEPGTYFVQVMAVDTGGVTDCPRFLRNCLDHWSNVRRVVVTASR